MVHRVVWRVAVARGDRLLGRAARRGAGIETERDGDSLLFADPEGLDHELLVAGRRATRPLIAEHPEVPAEHALQGFHAVRAYALAARTRSRGAARRRSGSSRRRASGWEARGEHRGGLYFYDEPPAERGIQGAGTVHHVAWTSDDEDHEAWRERVQRGRRPPDPGDRPLLLPLDLLPRAERRAVRDRDPIGPGFTVDEPLEHLGEKLSLPPFLESRRPEIEATVRPLENPRVAARS